MKDTRLSLALESGALSLPDTGRIAVFRPRAGADLAPLPRDRVQIIQGFRPDHDYFAAAGWATAAAPEGDYSAAIVCVPRAKAEARALIAEAARRVPVGAPIAVDGLKTDGIDGLLRNCRAYVEPQGVISKAHGKIFTFASPGPGVLDAWLAEAAPRHLPDGFETVAGVFSADGVDRGSALLAEALPAKLSPRVVDLGAGWGYLAAQILTREGVRELDLVEAEQAALDCARRNITDPRARFHWADATRFKPAGAVDAVVCNPPFHASRVADPGLGAAFIRAAAGMLTASGTLWLVANRHLPYEKVLHESFREVEEVGGDAGFKIYRAARPIAAARR